MSYVEYFGIVDCIGVACLGVDCRSPVGIISVEDDTSPESIPDNTPKAGLGGGENDKRTK